MSYKFPVLQMSFAEASGEAKNLRCMVRFTRGPAYLKEAEPQVYSKCTPVTRSVGRRAHVKHISVHLESEK